VCSALLLLIFFFLLLLFFFLLFYFLFLLIFSLGSRYLMPRMYLSHVAYCTTLDIRTITTSRLTRDAGGQKWS
jgi:hypothetical protein